jgi:hypothetical protein
MSRKFWWVLLGGLALAVFLRPEPVLAGSLPPEPEAPPSAWSFDGGLYGWVLWLQGDVTARGEDFNVYADPIDLIDALDGPIVMANFNAKRGRFSFFADVVYAEFGLESDFAAEAEPIPALQLKGDGRIGSQLDFGVYQADVFVEVANFAGTKGNNTTVELGAGARYVELDLTIKAKIDASARIRLGRLLGRIENRINRIENEEDRLEALAQFNAVRAKVLEDRIVRAKDKGLTRRVARLKNRLNQVDDRGQAIAALEAVDKLRLTLLRDALNLDNKDINGNFATVSTGDMDWVDPVIAMRVTHDLGQGRSLTAMGDFGGFNVDDGLSSQVVLTYDYEGTLFGYETTTSIGYKALWLRYEEQSSNGASGVNVLLHGPIAELAFRW